MKKVLIINNPVSGPKNKIYNPTYIRAWLLKRNITYIWFDTIPAAVQPFAEYINADIDRIIVIGGDGTVRAVADYLIRNKIKVPMAIVAKGTGNIIALSLGIPTLSVTKALAFALKMPAQPLDAMLVNDKYYGLIGAGQGYDSLFIKGATRTMKRQYGFLAYIYSFVSTFFAYRNRNYKIVIDGVRHYLSAKLVVVFNILSIRGLPNDSNISPRDGVLNIMVTSPRSMWDFMRIGGAFFLRMPKKKIPKFKIYNGKNISINQKGGRHIQLDGEVFNAKNLHVKVIPNALNMIYKKSFKDTDKKT
jgi:diacylglycerol kinase (ATP)